MCPVCIATAAALIAAKTGSAGGATAFVANKLRRKKAAAERPEISGRVEIQETGGEDDVSKQGEKRGPRDEDATDRVAAGMGDRAAANAG